MDHTTSTEGSVTLLWWFGVAVIGYKLTKAACEVFRLLVTYVVGRQKFNFKECGSWAVVTGATDGIGREYAEQLAADGINVALISRSQSKLQEVSAEISSAYGVQTKVICADFTGGVELFASIRQELHGIDIGILVNNVGMGVAARDFLDVPNREKLYPAMINCNSLAMAEMTSLVLPQMIMKNKGVIVNVSSFLAPWYELAPAVVYSSTKSFVSTLSMALHVEYGAGGVIIQNLTTGPVSTKMVQRQGAKDQLFTPSPATYVRAAIGTVPISTDSTGYLWHELTADFLSVLPRFAVRFLGSRSRDLLKSRQ